MKTAKEYFETCLGGNMNIATLKPVVFVEIIEEYGEILLKEVLKRQWNYNIDHIYGSKLKTTDEIIGELIKEIKLP